MMMEKVKPECVTSLISNLCDTILRFHMWEYLAGLFDGDGNPTIVKHRQGKHSDGRKKTPAIQMLATITISYEKGLPVIREFLKKEKVSTNVVCRKPSKKNKQKRDCYQLRVGSHVGCKKFFENIYPYVIFKRQQCEIMLKALNLKEELKSLGYGMIIRNEHLFDELRHELHRLSIKGPRNLKEW